MENIKTKTKLKILLLKLFLLDPVANMCAFGFTDAHHCMIDEAFKTEIMHRVSIGEIDEKHLEKVKSKQKD